MQSADDTIDAASGIEILLGLGSNLGDPPAQLRRAIEELRRSVEVETVSDLYITEPVGIRRQPDFANIVLKGRTALPAIELLERAQHIELRLGRTAGERYGPRLIDIDILAYGDFVMSTERLVIPHPWLHRRAFVLVPLVEIVPAWRHPVFGTTAEQMLRDLRLRTEVRRVGPLDLLPSPT